MRRKSTRRLFADVTAQIEDMHGIAVEGQAANLSPDIQWALLRDLNTEVRRLQRLIDQLGLCLARGQS